MDILEARNIISEKVNTAWLTKGLPQANLFFQDRKKDGPPITPETWARLKIVHLPGGPPTLAGASGLKRYTKQLLVTLQLFTPFNDGLATNDTLSQYFVDMLQGKGFQSLWFREVHSREIGNEGNWFQTNILANAEYDQLK